MKPSSVPALLFRKFTDENGDPLEGAKFQLTAIGTNTPMPYALFEGGPLLRGDSLVTDASGMLRAYLVRNAGIRLTRVDVNGNVIYQEDSKHMMSIQHRSGRPTGSVIPVEPSSSVDETLLAGLHINKGSLDSAADNYQREYDAELSARGAPATSDTYELPAHVDVSDEPTSDDIASTGPAES